MEKEDWEEEKEGEKEEEGGGGGREGHCCSQQTAKAAYFTWSGQINPFIHCKLHTEVFIVYK